MRRYATIWLFGSALGLASTVLMIWTFWLRSWIDTHLLQSGTGYDFGIFQDPPPFFRLLKEISVFAMAYGSGFTIVAAIWSGVAIRINRRVIEISRLQATAAKAVWMLCLGHSLAFLMQLGRPYLTPVAFQPRYHHPSLIEAIFVSIIDYSSTIATVFALIYWLWRAVED